MIALRQVLISRVTGHQVSLERNSGTVVASTKSCAYRGRVSSTVTGAVWAAFTRSEKKREVRFSLRCRPQFCSDSRAQFGTDVVSERAKTHR